MIKITYAEILKYACFLALCITQTVDRFCSSQKPPQSMSYLNIHWTPAHLYNVQYCILHTASNCQILKLNVNSEHKDQSKFKTNHKHKDQ